MGVGESQPGTPERQQPIQRRRIGTQRRRSEHECLLAGLLILVEQHHHQSGTAAEAAEHRAFTDSGGCCDVVHGDRVSATLVDQSAGRIQQQDTIARGVAAFLRYGDRQVANRIGSAHKITVASPEQTGP